MFRLTIVVALFGCALAGVSLIQPRGQDDLANGRIVGGDDADIEEFPYQAALLKGGSLFCGGSLLTKDVVLTAAHCLQSYKASEIKVRLGSSTYKSSGDLIQVEKFVFHEKYDSSKMINDVGLLKLSSPVAFSDKIQPIALATEVPPTGTEAVVTGWGTDKFLVGSVQSNLKKAIVDIVAKRECASDAYKYGEQIIDTMVCANVEGGGKDACQGDSGGPLASGGKLVGVVSWGNMCARKDYPGVYASVPELRSWILETADKL